MVQTARLTANLLFLVVTVLDAGHEDGGFVRKDQTSRGQVTVSSKQDGVKHALVQKEVAHPLGDDDINFVERQLDLFHFTLKKSDL